MSALRTQARELLVRTPAATAMRPLLGGAGVVLVMHEVQVDETHELRTGATPAYVARLLSWMQHSGWEFIKLGELLERLAEGKGGRFAAMTFDDGYRDNAAVALPILERLNIPACIFVPTAALERRLNVWWLGLREIIRERTDIDLEPLGQRFVVDSVDAKVACLRQVLSRAGQRSCNADDLNAWLEKNGYDRGRLIDGYFLTSAELRTLANHPLIEIGAHTTTHVPISWLPADIAKSECLDNKMFLESRLQCAVDHLAFPFGTPAACGTRDFEIARACGFSSAFTTKSSVVRRTNLDQRWSIPRFDVGQDSPLAEVNYKISGLAQHVSMLRLPSIGAASDPPR